MVNIEEASDPEDDHSDLETDMEGEEQETPKKKAAPKKKNSSKIVKRDDPMEPCWACCGKLAQW